MAEDKGRKTSSSSSPPPAPPPPLASPVRRQHADCDNNNDGGSFKKAHTCGSLFAKCHCHRRPHDDDDKPTTQQLSQQQQQYQQQSHTHLNHHRRSHPEQKRISNNDEQQPPWQHPELLVDHCCVRRKSRRSSIQLIAAKSLNDLDDARVLKFLHDFGICPPPTPTTLAMGNGATSVKKTSLEKRPESKHDYAHLRAIVPRLQKELDDLEIKYSVVQGELSDVKHELQCKEEEVGRCQREIHKLKSVLQQTTQNDDILARLNENNAKDAKSEGGNKKQGVSAESSDLSNPPCDISIPKYDKDFRCKQLIKEAILDNDFLKNLDSCQIREIVDSMYLKPFGRGDYVIREGDAGAHLFVSDDGGEFEVVKDAAILGQMGGGKAFGELAILYNCTRTASVRALVDSNVWVLDRKVFQLIMVRTGLQRLQDNINFLSSVPLLQNLSADVLAKIADVLEVEFYSSGSYIIRQGTAGDTFFILSSGQVKITQKQDGDFEEKEIRILERGDYFGEQALLKEDKRTASVIAIHPGVECLTLDRESFRQLIGDLSEIKEKDYGDSRRQRPSSKSLKELTEFDYIPLHDLDVIATLGIGGFGRVELVQYRRDVTLTFALKCLKKRHIIDTQQQEHVYSEKNIMLACRSPFICRLYRTYRDAKYVYMLLEACLGGEVWTILRDRGCFDEAPTRFIAACVVEAFEYLHARGIIYRDLKPENLLLDQRGYVKLVDFGFSKRMGYSSKTWTFCGTPEYVAPETILNKGHDRAVDYWALGILMHELLSGKPPFSSNDPMRTYNLILKGIDMIDFAQYNISRTAQSLIKKLCRDAPSERLGYQRGGIQDIKKHKWFQGFDWEGLMYGTLTAPIVQKVRGPSDFTNFDCYGRDNDIPPDEHSDWDIDF